MRPLVVARTELLVLGVALLVMGVAGFAVFLAISDRGVEKSMAWFVFLTLLWAGLTWLQSPRRARLGALAGDQPAAPPSRREPASRTVVRQLAAAALFTGAMGVFVVVTNLILDGKATAAPGEVGWSIVAGTGLEALFAERLIARCESSLGARVLCETRGPQRPGRWSGPLYVEHAEASLG